MARCLLWLLITLGAGLRAGPGLLFEHYTVGNGLTHNTIHALLQDSRGYLWVGTRYGLDRFDGTRFISFSGPGDSLRVNAVFSLLEDTDGSLWVGYQDAGLEIIPPGSVRGLSFQLGPDGRDPVDWSTITVRAIFRDSRGWTWIATYGGGVVVLDEHRQLWRHLRTYDNPAPGEALSNDFVFDFAEDAAGNVFIATAGDQINVWRAATGAVERLTPPPGHSLRSFAKTLLLGADGSLWIGTSGSGIMRYDQNGEWESFSERDGLSSAIVTDLAFAPDGRLWMATDGGGVNVLNPRTGAIDMHRNERARGSSLNSNAVYNLLFDQAGNLWAGTFDGGLNVHRPLPGPYVIDRRYTAERLAGVGSVLAAATDGVGRVWLGTDGSGVYHFATGTPGVEVVPYAVNASAVTCLQPVDSTGLWYGAYADGLSYVDLVSGHTTTYLPGTNDTNSLGHENVWDLALDPAGGLWIGLLGGGLDYLPPGHDSFHHIGAGPGELTDLQVIDVLADRDGRHLWVATERSGLNRLDRLTGAIRHYRRTPGGLPSDRLRTLYQDRSGTLWIGTEDSGLLSYDSSSDGFTRYGTEEGYPFTRVSGIVEDSSGMLWISGITDIYRWDRTSGPPIAIPPEPDLGYNLWNARAVTSLEDGRLLFGGVNGFSLLESGALPFAGQPPAAWVSDFYLDNRRVPLPLSDPDVKVFLTYRDRGIRFHLANAALLPPMAVRYAYRLVGFRDDWTELPPETDNLTFTSLPGGEYQLFIRTIAADGTYGPAIQAARLHVSPPFWQRAWFAVLVIAGMLATFYFLNAYLLGRERERHLRDTMKRDAEILHLRNEKLQHEVQQKQSELGASLLQVAHKNKFLDDLRAQIRELPDPKPPGERSAARAVLRIIDQEIRQVDYWEQFQVVFDEGYRAFVDRLRERHPELSTHESRLCCFLRMDLANQEIASIQNVTLSAVEQAKYRLKKKLNLPKSQSLNEYVRTFGDM